MKCDEQLSLHGQKLIKMYQSMADEGYDRVDGIRIDDAYNDFEMRKFRYICKDAFVSNNVKTVLDYGAGGSDWDAPAFDPTSCTTAKQFFDVEKVYSFEPARDLFIKTNADCVVCMDVLEHIFISDIPKVVDELFKLSEKLLIVNVACYKAGALLPNGENAHVTVRNPDWWKGVFDVISSNYKDIEVLLICSKTYVSGILYDRFKAAEWDLSQSFETHVVGHNFQPN